MTITNDKKTTCQICSNPNGNINLTFKDYHMGNLTSYDYFQCSNCQCLQKTELFEEHNQYYPEDYYSFARDDKTTVLSNLKWHIRDIRNAYYRSGKGTLGKLIHSILPCMSIAMIEKCSPDKSERILDVGCGSDALMLQYLSQQGYKNIFGVDPFIKRDIAIGNARIFKKSVLELNEQYNFITLNHSYEHMPNQKEILAHCGKLLTKNGSILLRIPIVDSYAWNHYKEFWPNLDAPRHLFLHSMKSIEFLIKECGMNIEKKWYDSTAFQFWGAELCRRGFALHQRNFLFPILKFLFRAYYSIVKQKTIEQLNREERGDTVALLLKNVK